VFAALNDPEVLRSCIPGCEELKDIGNETFAATLKLGLAGIKGTYTGSVSRRDLNPPESFTLVFDGKGAAGFVRGSASIRIVEDGAGSVVHSEADVQVGGAVAAVGSRLLTAAGQKLSQDFFNRLAGAIGARPENSPEH
jgi:carbon monoxide dehydrogenase subunit G